MDDSKEGPPKQDARISAILLAVLLGAIPYLFYGLENGPDGVGIAVLLAIPASLGGLFARLIDPDGQMSPMGCFGWPTLFLLGLVALAVLLFREGAICVAMILPLWLPAAAVGALVNRLGARRKRQREGTSTELQAAGWLLLPALALSADALAPVWWQDVSVRREVVIAASAERIWPVLHSIPAIEPQEGKANFTQDVLGIPRPSSAEVVWEKGRLIRKARWGPDAHFQEIITRSVPLRELAWNFSFQDGSIQAYTDRHISPDGPTLKIATGGYRLTPLTNGKTRLTLTTTYRMRARLGGYLRLWGEILLGDIQENVLAIVKQRAEV
jgi:hypothetical protein